MNVSKLINKGPRLRTLLQMEAPAGAHLQDRREERGRGGRDEGGGGRRQGTSPCLLLSCFLWLYV
jgi:hypothetical protein